MTEDEAKTKACCNGGTRPADNDPCIGSACMAWRWADQKPQPGLVLVDGLDGEVVVRELAAAHFGWPVLKDLSERNGFCGLAGFPQ